MANTATSLGLIPIGYEKSQAGVLTKAYKLAFDTTATDLTIHTPGAENFVAVIGLYYGEASAHNLTWTSGSTVLVAVERAANAITEHPLGLGALLTTAAAGEALKLQVSVAVTNMLIYVQEFKYLRF